MTRDDVLRPALEADEGDEEAMFTETEEWLNRYTALVMEECAKVCEQMAKRSERDLYGSVRCAAAIRERKP